MPRDLTARAQEDNVGFGFEFPFSSCIREVVHWKLLFPNDFVLTTVIFFLEAMRILALHGVGSSAKILESQLVGLMKSVDASYEFVLVDGPVPSHRGPGKLNELRNDLHAAKTRS